LVFLAQQLLAALTQWAIRRKIKGVYSSLQELTLIVDRFQVIQYTKSFQRTKLGSFAFLVEVLPAHVLRQLASSTIPPRDKPIAS